jgi:alcohol dehydrogenase
MGVSADGGFQTRVAIDERQAIPVTGPADLRSLALVEPVAVGVHACARAGLQAGMSLGIIGGGPIGMAIALQAEALGAEDITIVEPHGPRRSAIADRGTKALPEADSVQDRWDLVFDTVAAETTIGAAAAAARRGGRICIVGLHGGAMPPSSVFARRELTVIGSFCYTRDDLGTAANLVSAHGLKAVLVDLVDGLPAASDALEALSQGRLGRGKAIIVP